LYDLDVRKASHSTDIVRIGIIIETVERIKLRIDLQA
jgi:hypothetical protein